MKESYDKQTETCLFEPGDQVLALLPVVGSPFQARFSGPYTVKSRMSDRDYLVYTPDRSGAVGSCEFIEILPFVSLHLGKGDLALSLQSQIGVCEASSHIWSGVFRGF